MEAFKCCSCAVKRMRTSNGSAIIFADEGLGKSKERVIDMEMVFAMLKLAEIFTPVMQGRR